jgi:hypothetical protein
MIFLPKKGLAIAMTLSSILRGNLLSRDVSTRLFPKDLMLLDEPSFKEITFVSDTLSVNQREYSETKYAGPPLSGG